MFNQKNTKMTAKIYKITGGSFYRTVFQENTPFGILFRLSGPWAVNSKFSKGAWASLEELEKEILKVYLYNRVAFL